MVSKWEKGLIIKTNKRLGSNTTQHIQPEIIIKRVKCIHIFLTFYEHECFILNL